MLKPLENWYHWFENYVAMSGRFILEAYMLSTLFDVYN